MNKLLITVLLSMLFSCKGTNTALQSDNLQNKVEESVNIYRFNISFISIGSGIDAKAKQQFLFFINVFETQNNIRIEMEKGNWGREGEIDYCLKLAQLNANEQTKLISDIKELLKNSKLVRYTENTICNNKRN